MHLGDVITAASVIPVLKEQYPHSEIHYLVKDSVALPASLICGVDRVIPYTYQSGGGALDVIRMGNSCPKRAMIWGFPSILGSGLPS